MFPDKKYFQRASPLTSYQFSRLHTFECVARNLSFSLAAEELSITPSAVSHRINLLEKELGFLLFQRFHRRITLTPEGERMQWALSRSFDTLNQEILDIKNRELTGNLTIYSHPSIVQCLLIPRIGDFIAQHPTIHLSIVTGQEIISLANRGVDLAMYFGKLPSGKQIDEAFMQESIVPICTPQYAKVHNLYGAPENLAGCTLLHDRYNSGEDEWLTWSQHFDLALDTESKSMEFDRSDLAVLAATKHLGVAMGRLNLVQDWIKSGELIIPFSNMILPCEHCYFMSTISERQWPKILAFKEWLMKIAPLA
ncbi:DNA-binding transcriptional regulator DsdC [Serratia plymuthica]|uniref:DNA-binding transcriptional regulator DsdC n=1 Tax=Serratia plymuthica TaxID=82996 RepID=A0A2X4VFE4_SERPL|nr:DNA-binding transcriptional regulator DsdC [Serratia plymuthica]QPS19801.1 DNA-binding transcriptional regulator DsdC [Serratia plymuthica]QPS61513.1 DNA-binding transcriptional regulator DsdC [Serratia plymuthica]RKS61411.1 LysR family D-serine deaminase transcriptional activator [Serratia plymuthica]CAI2467528.1 Gcv operon activator [Serratia plymuthica]SQI44020.1 Gcv operon activator [Serratia plymuthica]